MRDNVRHTPRFADAHEPFHVDGQFGCPDLHTDGFLALGFFQQPAQRVQIGDFHHVAFFKRFNRHGFRRRVLIDNRFHLLQLLLRLLRMAPRPLPLQRLGDPANLRPGCR